MELEAAVDVDIGPLTRLLVFMYCSLTNAMMLGGVRTVKRSLAFRERQSRFNQAVASNPVACRSLLQVNTSFDK